MTAADSILDPPSPATTADLEQLRAELHAVPPKQVDRNLLIATWNLREFGQLAQVWDQPAGNKPFRDLHAVRLIGEVVACFDVVAIQEVQQDISALAALMKWLGPDWGLIMTDVTRGKKAGGERLAFVFDTRRVQPSGLAGELVLSAEQLNGKDPTAIREQFARTPYAVAFRSHGLTFILTTVHIIWGSGAKQRAPEIKAIADWLSDWSKSIDTRGHDLFVLGDFNIDRKDDANYQALIETGLGTPPELDEVARTVTSEDGDNGTFYDQIAWFGDKLKLRYTSRAGRVKWKGKVLADIDPNEATYRISDHYPIWTEFAVSETDPL